MVVSQKRIFITFAAEEESQEEEEANPHEEETERADSRQRPIRGHRDADLLDAFDPVDLGFGHEIAQPEECHADTPANTQTASSTNTHREGKGGAGRHD